MIFPKYNYTFKAKESYLPKNLEKSFQAWLLASTCDWIKLESLDYDYTLEVAQAYISSLDKSFIEIYDLGIEKAFCLVSNYFLEVKSLV
jgi:hypothetical protein